MQIIDLTPQEPEIKRNRTGSVRFDLEDDDGIDSESDDEITENTKLRKPKKQGAGKASSDSPSSLSVTESLTRSFDIVKTLVRILFSTTTGLDKFILILGTIFAFIHGIVFPFVAVLFGSMTNSFVQQSVAGFANSSSSSASQTINNFTTTNNNSTFEGDDYDSGGPAKLPTAKDVGISEKVADIFDLINQVVLKAFTEHQALSKDEFILYVSVTGKLFLWLAILVFVSSVLQVLCWEWVAANQKVELRESIVKKILRQDMIWIQRHDVGELIANIFSEVGRVRDALGYTFGCIVEYFAMFIITSLIAVFTNWRLALVFLAPTPFIIFKMLTLGQKIAKSSAEAHVLWNEAEAISEEILSNVDTVVAFGKQQDSINAFGSKLEEAIEQLVKKYHLAAIGKGVLNIIIYGSYSGAFWYGCKLLMQGSITPGEIYTIFLSITIGTIALNNIITSVSTVGTAYGSAKHLSQFGEPFPDIDPFSEDGYSGKDDPFEGEIEFIKVNFAYPNGPKILNDLSFKIEGGKTVAILSESGEGKTTIANLLLRLYDPKKGKIKIDGINLKKYNLKHLRQHMGIALQEPNLNEAEIDDNIRASRAFLPPEEIKRVKELVDPLNQLTSGFCDGKDAKGLPKHMRLKINMARSLASNPSILILDESFSGLESDEKDVVRDRVLQLRKGKTTIILTNDILSLGETVDVIYLLKGGQILPENIGSHAQLMEGEANAYQIMHHSATIIQALKAPVFRFAKFSQLKLPEWLGVKLVEEKPKGILEIFGITSSTINMFGLGLIGCVLTGTQLAIFAFYFVEIFKTFSKTGDQLASDGIFWAGMLLILAVVSGLGFFLRTLFMSSTGLYTILSVRTTAFTSILRRPKVYYDTTIPKTSPSALGTHVMCTSPQIKTVLENNAPEVISTTVTLTCIGIIVSALVWQIGLLLVLVVFPTLILLAILQYKYQKGGQDKFYQAESDTTNLITTAVAMIDLVQTHSMQEYYLQKYIEAVKPALTEAHHQSIVFSLLFGLSETLFFAFFGISFIYGSCLISSDAVTPESLFKIFFSMAFCILSFSQIVSQMPDFAIAMSSIESITKLILEEDKLDETLDALNENGEIVEDLSGKIEFSNVQFEYDAQHKVFDGLNLFIPPGETVAITGPSSFGGSTLFYLIQRFYDVKCGSLSLDDKLIKHLNIGQVREHIGWVPQRVSFFEGSIADNIKYGCKKEVSKRELREVLTTVKLIDVFGRDLNSYKDDLYWNTLSRGKRVLMAIARCLLRKPKILLLDNPTISMSPEEEMTVVSVIREIKKDRTCIIISIIPHTISLADKIVVIRDGKVLEEGSLDELLALDGYYTNWLKKIK